jgi:hypothetical protein
MSELLPDIYFSRDFPVLVEIGRWEAAGRKGRVLSCEELAEVSSNSLDQVIESVGRLYHAGLVEAAVSSTFEGDDYMIERLTGAGLQASGLWPTPASLSDALVEALKREVQMAERQGDRERSRKLSAVIEVLKEVGPAVAARVVETLLKAYGLAT